VTEHTTLIAVLAALNTIVIVYLPRLLQGKSDKVALTWNLAAALFHLVSFTVILECWKTEPSATSVPSAPSAPSAYSIERVPNGYYVQPVYPKRAK